MKEFFKYVFASMIGVILSCFVLFILFVIFITAAVSSAGSDKPRVSPNSVMRISLNFPISERTDKNPLADLDLFGETVKSIGLKDILAAIKNAKTDDNIKGIYLDVQDISAGYATTEEIRNALIDFKKSKKFIIAYSEIYMQKAYYLASVADKVYLNPEGLIDFTGFSTELTFFKGTLDKLDIEAQVIKVGTYKSAVEPFILDKMSDANRKQISSFLGSMYDHFLERISASRKIRRDSLFNIADNALVREAADAVRLRLADGLKYKDEVLAELKSKTGTKEKRDLRSISIQDYSAGDKKESISGNERIAVIYASGEIMGGEGSDEVIGSERISRAIRKARTDEKVKAVVFRINSPGGSALASDVIWREVVLTRKVKPVIVSFGDVAASGGYYIACAADSIFAQPNTITGSIGVFGIVPNMQKFFSNKLGMTFDGVKTGKFADLGSVTRPLTGAEKQIIQVSVNNIYKSFTGKVAAGRKKSQAYVDSIGQGRVWSGTEALQNGLVDRLGNIDDAIRSAAKKAGLKDYKVVAYPAQKDPFQSLFGNTTEQVRTWIAKKELGEHYNYFQQAKAALQFSGIQARLPVDISIK